jgi:hypothetical protein
MTLTGPLRSDAGLWQIHPDLDHPPRMRRRGRPRVYGARIGTPAWVLVITLVTSDLTTPVAGIVERYAARWSTEVAFHDAKNTTGVGEALNRTRNAVERTVPFGLLAQSIVIIWCHLAGHRLAVIRDRRHHAPRYTTKKHPSYLDMIVKLRRVLVAAQDGGVE